MRQRGFLSGIALYGAIGAVAVMGALGVALKIQSSRLESCQERFETFKLQTKIIAEAQDKKNREKEAADLKAKEKTDAQHKATVARLNADLRRMRDANARASLTPKASATTRRPDLACFDRTLFARALSEFEGEIEAIVGEGAARTIELDLAKAWAKSVQP